MSTARLIGALLIAVGVIDLVLGWYVIAPRVNPSARSVIRLALTIGAVFLVGLGVAFLSGWIPVAGSS
ncbi:MAG: hypothetical protein R3B81_02755 [bacterium]